MSLLFALPFFCLITVHYQGTPYFMPYEILGLEYIWIPEPPTEEPTDEIEILDITALAADSSPLAPPKRPNVVHNFQHDCESLWWLLLWTMTSRSRHKSAQTFGNSIFRNTMTLSPERRFAFKFFIEQDLLEALNGSNAPPFLAKFMEHLRYVLYKHYKRREKGEDLFKASSYVGVHQDLNKWFALFSSHKDSSWRKIKLNSLQSSNVDAATSPITEQPQAPTPSDPSKAKRLHPTITSQPPLDPTQGASEEGDVSSGTRSKRARK